MSVVSLVKTEDSTKDSIRKGIAESLKLIEYNFNGKKRIVIKPNLCYYWDYSTGQTTDPRFVSALIDVVREQASPHATISIVESDASAMRCLNAFKVLGYEKLMKEKSVQLVNLSEDKTEQVDVTVNGHHLRLNLPQAIKDADMRINVPKIKYMPQTTVSCAMKNIFGCNPRPKKYKYHPMLSEAIVALNKLMKFDLHVLDGLIVAGNSTCKLNLVMASRDPVAFDTAAARILSVNPKRVKHIVLANREGLGTSHFITKGESLKAFAKEYPKTKTTTKVLVLGYKMALKTRLLNPDTL